MVQLLVTGAGWAIFVSVSIRFFPLLALLIVSGCVEPESPEDDDAADDDDTSEADDDDAGDDDSGDDDTDLVPVSPCEFPDLSAAAIVVTEHHVLDPNYDWNWASAVDAWVWDRPWTFNHGVGAFQHVQIEEGECRFLALDPGACGGPCDPGQMCAADGTCQPVWSEPLEAGLLTITGVGDPVVLEPVGSGYITGNYHTHTTPPDLFAAFETITASFAGDVFPAAELSARGVAPIDLDYSGIFLPLVDGQDNVVTWTPGPDADACVSLLINGHNAGHGLPLGDIIWCVGPDDGSLTIPQAVVEAFEDGEWLGEFGGVSCEGLDCPPSVLSRYTRNEVEVDPGPVELIVRSTVYMGWTH